MVTSTRSERSPSRALLRSMILETEARENERKSTRLGASVERAVYRVTADVVRRSR